MQLKLNQNCWIVFVFLSLIISNLSAQHRTRERVKINDNWQFMRYEKDADKLMYDIRPEISDANDSKVADSRPTDAISVEKKDEVLKNWILPSANPFIKDSTKWFKRPLGNPGSDFPFVQSTFDDSHWQSVNLPHDWAIKEPFYNGDKPTVGGGMGRLPSHGVAWYRKKLAISASDKGKKIYLDIDGAMSYAIVWLNGNLIGGWPYGYNSFRLDITKFLNYGGENQLAIRLDNPNHSARWYPGGGLYRNVWLTKTSLVHVAHWGTQITIPKVSTKEATVKLDLQIENHEKANQNITVKTEFYLLDDKGKVLGKPVVALNPKLLHIQAGKTIKSSQEILIKNPKLWGVYSSQKPNLYIARTQIFNNNLQIDEYDTQFGIRNIILDPLKGVIVNGTPIRMKGVNQHHDLGALGAAFNVRAAERQLELLRELGCNAIRMSHNPPAPELLDLTDRMGFLVIDEVFDSWYKKKTPHDFHLIFPEWHEPDTRSFIRRDRNHPSIMAWSFGNEVGEQYTEAEGAAVAQKLIDIVHEEDPTRPASASQNFAKPEMPFTKVMDFINLNYQGEGIRDAPAYAHLKGIRTTPLYPAFQKVFPEKMIVSTETASALSTRGSYLFPVFEGNSAPVSNGVGGNPITKEVSGYELYTAQFGSSPDKVFATQDKHPFVAGEFVWTGWDYIGEPTPYYTARSSYSGIIDLAGFKKDRFYLYQSRWRPELPMVHILPHWNWPDRVGEITPVHVFTTGDETELFLNGKSLGRKKKGEFEYRIRWDDVKYKAGELKAISYKNGKHWAEETIRTTDKPAQLVAQVDRNVISNDGEDLSFITIKVEDKDGLFVANANLNINFSIEGNGEIVATDNGDPADLISFASTERKTFNGLALAIVRFKKGQKGTIKLTATAEGLKPASAEIKSK